MTAEQLIAFETDVARRFNAGEIRAPVHLYSGNESQMIEIFRQVGPDDWVFCSWRSHYQCLLKGVPPDQVLAEILAGRSIGLCFPAYRIYSSAIVGGSLPIALGVALAIKRRGGSERVHVFMGDMTARTGIAHEVIRYAANWGLPIRFIIEDNGLSVCTDTKAVWNEDWARDEWLDGDDLDIQRYEYRSRYPHAGAGSRVEF